jgi:hypothetical protein
MTIGGRRIGIHVASSMAIQSALDLGRTAVEVMV